jgi:hypothetical protein
MSRTSFADRIAARFSPDLDRRSFLSRTAMVGTALAVTPTSFVLRPGDAYSQVCSTPSSCPSGSRCTGYTELCCSLYGYNACPPGTTMAGWWRADGSGYCGPGAPRYYMDCNGYGQPCTCWGCNCNNWKTSCTNFRYGNCNNHVPNVGPIRCRVISCTPPWQIDPGCSTAARIDNNTRFHDRPCLNPPPPPVPTDGDLWVVSGEGGIWAQNAAPWHGGANNLVLANPIVGMARTASKNGYWLVASDGGIFSYGDAQFFGSTGAIRLNKPIVGMASTPTSRGYWLVASDGGVFCFGDAQFYGSTGAITLNQPVVAMASTPSGRGYWLVARDGGVFCFGDAVFHGSAVGFVNGNYTSIAPHPGGGYWLGVDNGYVINFGSAPQLALDPPSGMTSPIVAIAATTSGNGYYQVAANGSIYPNGDAGLVIGTGLPLWKPAVGAASFR